MSFADGFDDAIVGLAQRFKSWFVVYDKARVLQTLVERDGMSEEDAVEFFDFNIVDAWDGEGTPCFLVREIFDGEVFDES